MCRISKHLNRFSDHGLRVSSVWSRHSNNIAPWSVTVRLRTSDPHNSRMFHRVEVSTSDPSTVSGTSDRYQQTPCKKNATLRRTTTRNAEPGHVFAGCTHDVRVRRKAVSFATFHSFDSSTPPKLVRDVFLRMIPTALRRSTTSGPRCWKCPQTTALDRISCSTLTLRAASMWR